MEFLPDSKVTPMATLSTAPIRGINRLTIEPEANNLSGTTSPYPNTATGLNLVYSDGFHRDLDADPSHRFSRTGIGIRNDYTENFPSFLYLPHLCQLD